MAEQWVSLNEMDEDYLKMAAEILYADNPSLSDRVHGILARRGETPRDTFLVLLTRGDMESLQHLRSMVGWPLGHEDLYDWITSIIERMIRSKDRPA